MSHPVSPSRNRPLLVLTLAVVALLLAGAVPRQAGPVIVSLSGTQIVRSGRLVIHKLAVLALNLCSNRLQMSCPVRVGLCASSTLGPLLFEAGALLASGDCRTAAACSGLPDRVAE